MSAYEPETVHVEFDVPLDDLRLTLAQIRGSGTATYTALKATLAAVRDWRDGDVVQTSGRVLRYQAGESA